MTAFSFTEWEEQWWRTFLAGAPKALGLPPSRVSRRAREAWEQQQRQAYLSRYMATPKHKRRGPIFSTGGSCCHSCTSKDAEQLLRLAAMKQARADLKRTIRQQDRDRAARALSELNLAPAVVRDCSVMNPEEVAAITARHARDSRANVYGRQDHAEQGAERDLDEQDAERDFVERDCGDETEDPQQESSPDTVSLIDQMFRDLSAFQVRGRGDPDPEEYLDPSEPLEPAVSRYLSGCWAGRRSSDDTRKSRLYDVALAMQYSPGFIALQARHAIEEDSRHIDSGRTQTMRPPGLPVFAAYRWVREVPPVTDLLPSWLFLDFEREEIARSVGLVWNDCDGEPQWTKWGCDEWGRWRQAHKAARLRASATRPRQEPRLPIIVVDAGDGKRYCCSGRHWLLWVDRASIPLGYDLTTSRGVTVDMGGSEKIPGAARREDPAIAPVTRPRLEGRPADPPAAPGERKRAALVEGNRERASRADGFAGKHRRRILKMRAAGLGYAAIAAKLNGAGVPGPTGGRWSGMAVRRVASRKTAEV